jgi:hypothetical protein
MVLYDRQAGTSTMLDVPLLHTKGDTGLTECAAPSDKQNRQHIQRSAKRARPAPPHNSKQ